MSKRTIGKFRVETAAFSVVCASICLIVFLGGCNRSLHVKNHEVAATYNGGIFGGTKAESTDRIARAVVGVEFVREGHEPETCTGTLIAPRTVLTAAHCALVAPQYIKIQFAAELGPTLPEELHRTVSRVYVHPNYSSRQEELVEQRLYEQANQFDVAILNLSEPAPAWSVPLSIADVELAAGSVYSAAGFGAQAFDMLTGTRVGGGPSQLLQTVTLKNLESRQPGVLLFDQSVGQGICVGDSGGPAYVNDPALRPLVYGIASSVRNPGHSEVCEGVARFVSAPLIKAWVDSLL